MRIIDKFDKKNYYITTGNDYIEISNKHPFATFSTFLIDFIQIKDLLT